MKVRKIAAGHARWSFDAVPTTNLANGPHEKCSFASERDAAKIAYGGAAVFHFAVCDGRSSPPEGLRAVSVRGTRVSEWKIAPAFARRRMERRGRMGGVESERGKSSEGSTSMSAASDSPAGPQSPYAPKRPRDPEQSRPQADRFSSRMSRVEADDLSESDPPIPWRRVRPGEVPSLIGRPPLP